MENSNNIGTVIGSVLIGAAVGGILGVLFAPDKGSETRRKIAAKGEDLKGYVQDKVSEVMDHINTNDQANDHKKDHLESQKRT